MPIALTNPDFVNELVSGSVPTLQANILDKQVITLDFESTATIHATQANTWSIVGDEILAQTPPGWEDIIFPGSSVEISSTQVAGNSVTKVVDTVTAYSITMTTSFSGPEQQNAKMTLHNVTLIAALDFSGNFIENGTANTFVSLVDGNEIGYLATGLLHTDTSWTAAVHQGQFKSNDIGSIRVKGNGGTIYNQAFQVEVTTYVHPFFLASQLSDILADVAPSYFSQLNSLNYIYQVHGRYIAADPNKIQSSTVLGNSVFGNCGWFGEHLNIGVPSIYSLGTVTYSDTVSGDPVASVQSCKSTDISITIVADNAVFSDTNTQFVLNHVFLPAQAQHDDTTTDMAWNYMFDRALQTVGVATVDGDNFGTTNQVLTNVAGTYNSTTQVTITATVDMSVQNTSRISAADYYLLAVAIGVHTGTAESNDRVTLKIPVVTYSCDQSDDSIFDSDIRFIQHGEPDFTDKTWVNADDFVEDHNPVEIGFWVDRADDALIQSVTVLVLAEHDSEPDLTLEERTFDFTQGQVISGAQVYEVSETRGYKLDSTDIRNKIVLTRDAASDTGTKDYYTLTYAFTERWEKWVALQNPPTGSPFWEPGVEPQDGLNHEWPRYHDGSGVTIRLYFNAIVEQFGVNNIFTNSGELIIDDYAESAIYSVAIDTQDESTLTSTVVGGEGIGFANNETRIVATFTRALGPMPPLANVHMWLGVKIKDQDGPWEIYRMSSVYDVPAVSQWASTDSSDKTVKTNPSSGVYKGTAKIKAGELVEGVEYELTARILEEDNCIYWEFDTDSEKADVFSPILITAGIDPEWDLDTPNGPFYISSNPTYPYPNGSGTKTVKVCFDDVTNVSSMDLNGDDVVGTLDFSATGNTSTDAFENCHTIVLDNNPLLTGVTFPALIVASQTIQIQTTGVTSIDLSPLGSNIAGQIFVASNPALITLTLPSSAGAITYFRLNDCDALTSVDISPLTGISGIVECYGNALLATITMPASIGSLSAWTIRQNPVLTAIDCSIATFAPGCSVDMQSNILGPTITYPSSGTHGPTSLFTIEASLQTGAIDTLNLELGGLIRIRANTGITSFATAASAGIITQIEADGCSLSGLPWASWTGANNNMNVFMQNNAMTAGEVEAEYAALYAKGWTGLSLNYTGTNAAATRAITVVVSVDAGGSGYSVSDTIDIVGGGETSVGQLTVATVSGGAVTGVTITTPGAGYSTVPNDFTTTSGGGTGADFTLHTWILGLINTYGATIT